MTTRPAKNGPWTDHSKNDASAKKDRFPAEHIFLGTTSCTILCTILQAESAYSKTPVEYILQNIHHAHLHDKCMITMLCHQFIFEVC